MSKKIIVGVLLTAALIIGAGKVMDVKKPLLEAKQEEVAPEVETETEPEEVKEIKTEEVKEPEKSAEELLEEQIDKMIADMSLEERVLQLFVITPEALTRVDTVVAAGEATKEAIIERPVGGLIYFQKNLQNPEQVKEMLSNTYQYYREAGAPVPFLSVDEEGGSVARIGGQSAFGVERLPDMRVIGENGNVEEAKRVGDVIGSYLSELGFNLDFAPDADVLTNPQNEVVKKRSFGSDAELVSRMSMAVVKGLEEHGIYATLKHYPGHGATLSDSHKGYAYTDKTLEELMEEELIPFKEGISEDIQGRSIPNDIYGFAKYIMNELALASANVYNLRLFACYGPFDHESKFITHCIRCCLRDEEITIRQNCMFDYIHVYDLAKVMLYAIENDLKEHVYNIGSGQKYSLLEIAEKVRLQMSYTKPIVILKEGWNKEYTPDISRLKSETGLPGGFLSLDEGIALQIMHEKENWYEEKNC